jgi:hypothetical protein
MTQMTLICLAPLDRLPSIHSWNIVQNGCQTSFPCSNLFRLAFFLPSAIQVKEITHTIVSGFATFTLELSRTTSHRHELSRSTGSMSIERDSQDLQGPHPRPLDLSSSSISYPSLTSSRSFTNIIPSHPHQAHLPLHFSRHHISDHRKVHCDASCVYLELP